MHWILLEYILMVKMKWIDLYVFLTYVKISFIYYIIFIYAIVYFVILITKDVQKKKF
jgi:hypothetical protein